jgi:methyl-CpG-binding domain protein 4
LGDPWRVIVASVLLNRTSHLAVRPILMELFEKWPSPSALGRADVEDLAALLRPLGLHRRRARILRAASWSWEHVPWTDARDLPGVGPYVADAVGIFCFGHREMESSDHVLRRYLDATPQEV